MISTSLFPAETQKVLTLLRPNSLRIPLPLPDSEHRFFTVVGRVYLPNVLSCSCAWCRTCGGNAWFRATNRYALRTSSLALTPLRAFISRSTRMFGMS
jgi:hypothetical protein